MVIALPMQIFYKIFYYPIRLLDWTGTKTVRLFGLHPSGEHGSSYTEDEIRQLIKISQESGHLNEEERRLINQVFEFSETTVREAMIPRTEIVAIPANFVARRDRQSFSRTRLFASAGLCANRSTILRGVHSQQGRDAVSARRTANVQTRKSFEKTDYVVDTARLEDVLRQMQREKFHFGFVVDEHGGVEGIITLEDLVGRNRRRHFRRTRRRSQRTNLQTSRRKFTFSTAAWRSRFEQTPRIESAGFRRLHDDCRIFNDRSRTNFNRRRKRPIQRAYFQSRKG